MPGGVQAVVELSGGLYILADAVAAAGLVYGDRLEIEIGDGHIALRLDPACARAAPRSRIGMDVGAGSAPRFVATSRHPGPVVVAEEIASIDGP